MQNNTKIFLALALLILVVGALLYEVRTVPDVKWRALYDYNDEEPQGLYVFKEIVTRYFEGVDSKIQKEYKDSVALNGLFIYGGRAINRASFDTLIKIADDGNDVFVFCPSYPYWLNDTLDKNYKQQFIHSDRVTFDFMDQNLHSDTTMTYRFVDNELKYRDSSSFALIKKRVFYDTYIAEDETDYETDYEDEYEVDYNNYENGEIVSSKVVTVQDSLILMLKFKTREGSIYFHMLPEMFFNYSYRQPQMFDYTTNLLSLFDPEHIVFVNKLTGRDLPPTEHPLQFIMSSPPLKAAYYLLVIGMLLYAFFGGKRKQKAIPITDKNENTSLEYIETVSQLFYQQDKHEKLVAHMRNVFYHKMEQKFFIKKDHPTYLETLTKKSKIPESDLKYILDRFKNLEDEYSFQADQLISLNKRIEQVYLFINKKD